jgi:putative DNA primase/helicase
MTNANCATFEMNAETGLNIKDALARIVNQGKVSRGDLAIDLGVDIDAVDAILDRTEWHDLTPWLAVHEEVSSDDTRRKLELLAWAEGALKLSEADLEFELTEAAARFAMTKTDLRRIINAHRKDKKAGKDKPGADRKAEPETDIRFYDGFKSSSRGLFGQQLDKDGGPFWEQISTTRLDVEALTRDARQENWGTYAVITNRDGYVRKLAIPLALIAADKVLDIAGTLGSLGVGVVPTKAARQLIVRFLTVDVPDRITAVGQIGWTESDGAQLFVLPDETVIPAGYVGARPVLQTATLQTQHGLDVGGTAFEWIEQIARPLAGNSNVHLCVGTAFASPLLYWALETPGFFHLFGPSKTGKTLAAAIGQSVWGRPKVPGEANTFGASWQATTVGLERYAVLRSDVGASFDEIGEGQPKAISAAIYSLANGSVKMRGTQDVGLRPMESFRILAISTGEPPMVAFLTAAGENVAAGLMVRFVDVPAEVQAESAFETCAVHQLEEFGKQFYPLTSRLHGAVGRVWLQYLVDLGPKNIEALLKKHREEWLSIDVIAAMRAAATAQVRTVINRFALVAAALRMAIGAGLLPWTVEETDLGVAACMVRWASARKGRLGLAGEMVAVVEQIRAILVANIHGRFIHLQLSEETGELEYCGSDESKRDTLGFVKGGLILIEPSAWRDVFCAGYDAKKTAEHLKAEGLLHHDPESLQQQSKVLRGGSVQKGRFYALDMRVLEDAVGTGPKEDAR